MEENPHALSISPDGQWLAVANYLGTVDDNRADSSIALIDLRPESENYLEVVAWIANQ